MKLCFILSMASVIPYLYKNDMDFKRACCPYSLRKSELREKINHDRVIVSPSWHAPSNTHGFALDGKSYQPG